LPKKKGQSFITGGGTHNVFLLRIQSHLPEIKIIILPPKLLNLRSFVFALLGVLKLREENNVLSSVTGATDHSSGVSTI
jgi:anhydro-N-acetylmuramic acid kinase